MDQTRLNLIAPAMPISTNEKMKRRGKLINEQQNLMSELIFVNYSKSKTRPNKFQQFLAALLSEAFEPVKCPLQRVGQDIW